MKYGEVQEIPFAVLNPAKEATLRLPTAEQMLERLRVQRTIRRDMGRRRSKTEFVRNPAADLKLFNALRMEQDGPDFDEFEAEHAIGILTAADVTASERAGSEYRVDLQWRHFGALQGDTQHYMRIPTLRQLKEYQRAVISAHDLPHGVTEMRYNIAASLELYDALFERREGYADDTPTPPHHKSAVVAELNAVVQAQDQGSDPAGF